jgi:hypothetical protein
MSGLKRILRRLLARTPTSYRTAMLRQLVLLFLTLSTSLQAQAVHRIGDAPKSNPPATGQPGMLQGMVFDSLHSVPLEGATVVLSGTVHTATTDIGGRFSFPLDSIPEGRHTVGFFHPTLDSLGITPPTSEVEIRRGQSLRVDLAIPSMATILRAVCPANASADGRGLVMGVVRDAESEKPLPGARVVFLWTLTNVATNAVVKVPQGTSAVVNPDGSYRACGIPADTRVTAQARAGKWASGWIELTIPPRTVLLRDFLLGMRDTAQVARAARADTTSGPGGAADTSRTRAAAASSSTVGTVSSRPAQPAAPLGKAVLSGTVIAADGKPLEGALVALLGTALSTRTDAKGAFRLAGLPAGTQSVEVKLLGYAPKRMTVDLSALRESKLSAVLDERATVLNPVTVAARESRDLTGFDERRRRGMGAYMTREDIEKRGSYQVTDLFRTIPGVQVLWVNGAYEVQMARAQRGTYCPVQYFVDGNPFLASGDEVNQVLRPDDIEGIEVYKSATETPIEYQRNGASCGTIVIWTRRGAGKK